MSKKACFSGPQDGPLTLWIASWLTLSSLKAKLLNLGRGFLDLVYCRRIGCGELDSVGA